MTKILFCDIDGTLTETISGKPFKQHPGDVKALPGTQKAIINYAARGYKVFGVSNQGGCDTINRSTGKPFKSIDDTVLEMQITLKIFPEIEAIYFCPSMSGEYAVRVERDDYQKVYSGLWDGLYRKPDIGMVNEIIYITDNPHDCLFVGDREEDRQCADSANIPYIHSDLWRSKFI